MREIKREIARLDAEFDGLRQPIEDDLKARFIGKMVKFPNKGWNKGYIVGVGLSGSYYGGELDLTYTICPNKERVASQARRVRSNDVELMTDEEVAAHEKGKALHEAINNRGS